MSTELLLPIPSGIGTPGGGSNTVLEVKTPLAVQTGGDITGAGADTVWHEIAALTGGPGTGGLDLTIAAAVGDVLQCQISAEVATVAASIFFDMLSVNNAGVTISGSNLNNAQFGVGGWVIQANNQTTGGSLFLYTVVAADIAAGNVVLRPYERCGAAVGKTIFRSAANGTLQFSVLNLRH